MSNLNAVDFKDLETRGFVLVPSFLSEAELHLCREDFARQAVSNAHRNYTSASRSVTDSLKHRVQEVLALVASRTNLRVDRPLGAAYFATGRRVRFGWHQDHESFFSVQNHYDYLNFYIPIVKPRRDKSNLSLVPFDVLERDRPDTFRRVVRGGANSYVQIGKGTIVSLDDTGSLHLMPGVLDSMAHTPMLEAGDLLLLRGDMIHRTEDADTERVSLSFRVASSGTMVHRSRLVRGSWIKTVMMARNKELYERIFTAFDQAGKGAMTVHDLEEAMSRVAVARPRSASQFVRYLLWQKLRARVPGLSSGALSGGDR
jgi:hypothetical protein